MKWRFDDGGRYEALRKRCAGDCVARSVAIATEIPYGIIHQWIHDLGVKERIRKGHRSHPDRGVNKVVYRQLLRSLGWQWQPTMGIGTGCRVHLREHELPPGRLVVEVSRHMCAVVDGIIHDTYDPSRGGTRCVYGYWHKGNEECLAVTSVTQNSFIAHLSD